MIPLTKTGAAAGAVVWSAQALQPVELPVPELAVSLPGAPPEARLEVSGGPGMPWTPLALNDGEALLPVPLRAAADLWALRLRVTGTDAAPRLVPARPFLLVPEEGIEKERPAQIRLANWSEASAFEARAFDAAGDAVPVLGLSAPEAPGQDGWTFIGFLPAFAEASLEAVLTPDLSYPVVVEVKNERGEAQRTVLAPINLLAGPGDQIHYYGMAKPNWNCAKRVYNGTYLWIVGIQDGTTYTVTDLDTAGVIATGTVNRGQKATLVSPNPVFVDDHRFRLATSRPVQAYMGFDCSGTLPGTMFFLADDGVSFWGSSFTVPVGGLDGRTRYVVFATGAGTAEIRTLSGALVASNTFSGAGYWDATASLTQNTVYAVTSSGTAISVEQSSQNAATEVPPTTMVAGGGCATSSLGSKFYVHVQSWSKTNPALVAIGYQDVGWRYRSLSSESWSNPIDVQTGNLTIQNVDPGFYEVEVTTPGATMGLLAGSYEGGTSVYDLGDDSVYYRGTGSDVRGHALRCGGSIFVGHDGTQLSATGATTTPSLPGTFNSGDVISLAGNTANNTPFRVYSQDAAHPVVVEVFGGNCATSLNDWSKVMLPAALARPVITYPDTSGYLNDLTPDVAGTAVPGATVTLRIYDHTAGDTLVFTGTAVAADGTGAWTIPVTDPLTENHLYYFEAVQAMDGACSVDPLPPPGSSGSQGTIDTTPPAAPAVLAVGNDTGTSGTDGVTADNTLVFSGTAEPGATVHVFLNGVEVGTTTADGSGAWAFDHTGTALLDGSYTVTAIAEDAAHNVSPASAPFALVVDTTPPAVSITTPAEGSTTTDPTPLVSGTTDAPPGSLVTVAIGTESHTAVVQADGSWSLEWPTPLPDGPYTVSASIGDTAGNTGTDSNTFTVAVPSSEPPIVTSPLYAGPSVTVAGSSVEAPGSTVTVFVDGVAVGTAVVQSDGTWSFGPLALAAGQQVSATVLAPGKASSGPSNTVVVGEANPGLTPPPSISTPIADGATSLSGTSVPGAVVDLYADGLYLGTVTADGSGTWTLSGLDPLPAGTILSATATATGLGTSEWSDPAVVGNVIHLLRSDALTSLNQPIAPLFERRYPRDTALAPVGPNHMANWGEGANPSLPGTTDDDKAYLANVHSGDLDPDTAVLTDDGRPLVFYELLDNNQKTLFLTKSGGRIQITFTP
ncbi:MAG: Ig-like domain-containing protein [Acidobacteriota bacterium]